MNRGATLALGALLCGLTLAGPVSAQAVREGRPGTRPEAKDTDEDAQPAKLPPLPSGMTLALVRQGDSLFRGKGGCVSCHGEDATGLPAMGSSLTTGLHFIPQEWGPIDSLIAAGIPESITRTPIAMPPRGAQSNLTPEETRAIAAYVWAISTTRGEPWPGGHRTHPPTPAGAASR
ncbi:MAG TPA: c-type cytochrome [Gemmatimonadales bacterium]|nr:c-type cytochrome [Gemmatimonadales bacterium]